MNMKFKKTTLIKVLLVVALVVTAPYLVPFTLDFIIVADLMGFEALLVFLFVYAKSLMAPLRLHLSALREHLGQTALLVARLYMFRPRVYLGHAAASSAMVLIASSVLLACALWLPVMLMSAELATTFV